MGTYYSLDYRFTIYLIFTYFYYYIFGNKIRLIFEYCQRSSKLPRQATARKMGDNAHGRISFSKAFNFRIHLFHVGLILTVPGAELLHAQSIENRIFGSFSAGGRRRAAIHLRMNKDGCLLIVAAIDISIIILQLAIIAAAVVARKLPKNSQTDIRHAMPAQCATSPAFRYLVGRRLRAFLSPGGSDFRLRSLNDDISRVASRQRRITASFHFWCKIRHSAWRYLIYIWLISSLQRSTIACSKHKILLIKMILMHLSSGLLFTEAFDVSVESFSTYCR